MAADAKLVMQASVTKTAAFDSTAIDLATRSPLFGNVLWCRVLYSATNTSAGAGALTFEVQESADNSTFVKLTQVSESVITLSTTAQSGEIFIPIVTSKRYVRLSLTGVSGTGATTTYAADLVMAKP
jgi:Bbp16